MIPEFLNLIWVSSQLAFFLFIPGFLLQNAFARERGYNLSFSESLFLWSATSVTVSGIIAMLLAYFGVFSLINLSLAIVTLIAITWWIRRPQLTVPNPKLTLNSTFLLLTILLAVHLFFMPFEWILGGGDPGTYMNTGFHIARKGSVFVIDDLLGTVDGEVERYLYSNAQYLGYYITNRSSGEVVPQFLYLYPSIIAIFYSIGGLNLSLFTTPFLAILSLMAIYLATKEIFNTRVALISLILLTTNFLIIWGARQPNSEVLVRLLLFSGIYALSLYFKTKNNFYTALSALFFGGMLLTRIDAWMMILPMFFILIMLQNSSNKHRSFLTFVGTFLALYFTGWYTLFYISYPYTHDIIVFNLGKFSKFLELGSENPVDLTKKILLILSLAIPLSLIVGKRFRVFSLADKILTIIIIIIFIIFLTRFFIPIAFNQMTELVSISFYHWSWLGFTMTTAGTLLIPLKKLSYEKIPFLIFAIFFATDLVGFVIVHRMTPQPFLEYLVNLTVSDSADLTPRPFISRYFAAMILPALIIFCAVFLDFLISKNKKTTLILMVLLLINLSIISSPTFDLKNYVEYKGAIKAVNDIGNELVKDSIVITYGGKHFSHLERLAVPLYYLEDEYVRPFMSSHTMDLIYTINQLKNKLNKSIYLMAIVPSENDVIKIDPKIAKSNLSVYFVEWPFSMSRFLSWIEFGKVLFIPVNYYGAGYEKFEITICKVDDANCNIYLNNGWYSKEEFGNLKWRWISKKAEVLINSDVESYVLIKINLVSFNDDRNLKVKHNGIEIFETIVKTEEATIKIPAKFVKGYNLLELESDSCSVPKEIFTHFVSLNGKINVSVLYLARDDRCLSFSTFELSINLLEPWKYLDVGTEEAEKYLLKGWSHSEKSGNLSFVWANDLNSSIAIVLEKERPLNLSFRCAPFSFNESVSQMIQVFFNGNYVTSLSLKRGWSEYNVSVPLEFVKEGINLLEFRYKYAERPKDHGINNDTRRLAVAFDWIKINN